jgi:hypothetical protein
MRRGFPIHYFSTYGKEKELLLGEWGDFFMGWMIDWMRCARAKREMRNLYHGMEDFYTSVLGTLFSSQEGQRIL